MKYCFGADVGGTTIKLGLFTVDGEILDKWEIITRTENEGESILQDIATALKEKIQEKAIPAEEVIGIGMGIPAPVKFGRYCEKEQRILDGDIKRLRKN